MRYDSMKSFDGLGRVGLAVGPRIGTVYAKAIDVMNIGAKANGLELNYGGK